MRRMSLSLVAWLGSVRPETAFRRKDKTGKASRRTAARRM